MCMRAERWIGLILASASLMVAQLCSPAQANGLIDLGVGHGYAVNNSGQVVLDQGIYSNGTLTPLPALPGGTSGAHALAINASGQVAGYADGPNNIVVAIVYGNGTLTNLGNPFGGTTLGTPEPAYATGINASGQVVGSSEDSSVGITVRYSWVYSKGTFSLLGGVPGVGFGSTDVAGINDTGEIAGTSAPRNAPSRAWIFTNGVTTDLLWGEANAINASGQVTGSVYNLNANRSLAFIYSNGTTANLGALPGDNVSVGYAINAGGQVVGNSSVAGSLSAGRAFFYNGVMSDLNSLVDGSDPLKSFVTLTHAQGINDGGLIVVNGLDARDGSSHAFLMQLPPISIAPGGLSFASQSIGTVSPTQTETVSNVGTANVTLGAISVSSDFTQTNDCSAALAPGGSCTIQVAFAPATSGDRTGNLTVTAGGTPLVVALSGATPISATISADPTTVITGQNVTLTWTFSAGASCAASGGASGDGWTGSLLSPGTQLVTEATAGTYRYGLSCTAGAQAAQPNASVAVTWPAVTVSLSTSPAAIVAGQSTTLTWSSNNATSCTATGGGPGDGWPGSKATSGSASVPESYVPASAAVTLTFTLSCTSVASGQSAQATAQVIEKAPPTTKSGGGAFDVLSLFALSNFLGIYAFGRRSKTRDFRPML